MFSDYSYFFFRTRNQKAQKFDAFTLDAKCIEFSSLIPAKKFLSVQVCQYKLGPLETTEADFSKLDLSCTPKWNC